MGLAKILPSSVAHTEMFSSGLVCYLGLTPVLLVFYSESSSYPSILRGIYSLYFCLELGVSGFKLRSLIRCELIFVQDEKYESNFIFL